MADDKSEEFKRFILENREMIESILDEGRTKTVDNVKDFSDAILRIMSDDEVQKHFISGCLEFVHCLEAVMEAAPLSKEARETVEKMEDVKDNAVKNVVIVGAKDKFEHITINDVKKDIKKKTKKE